MRASNFGCPLSWNSRNDCIANTTSALHQRSRQNSICKLIAQNDISQSKLENCPCSSSLWLCSIDKLETSLDQVDNSTCSGCLAIYYGTYCGDNGLLAEGLLHLLKERGVAGWEQTVDI
jgi:hypothetical protein